MWHWSKKKIMCHLKKKDFLPVSMTVREAHAFVHLHMIFHDHTAIVHYFHCQGLQGQHWIHAWTLVLPPVGDSEVTNIFKHMVNIMHFFVFSISFLLSTYWSLCSNFYRDWLWSLLHVVQNITLFIVWLKMLIIRCWARETCWSMWLRCLANVAALYLVFLFT